MENIIMTWEYVAGYFDGEGHAFINKNGRGWCMGFSNTHKGSLDQIQQFLNAGRVKRYTHPPNQPNKKTVYHLNIYKIKDLQRIIPELRHRCIIKAHVLDKLLAHISNLVPAPDPYGEKTIHRVNEIINMYCNERFSLEYIGAQMGVSRGTIAKRLRENGIKRRTPQEGMIDAVRLGRSKHRNRQKLFDVSPETIRNMIHEGHNDIEIAKQFNVAPASIWAFRKRHNIPRQGLSTDHS